MDSRGLEGERLHVKQCLQRWKEVSSIKFSAAQASTHFFSSIPKSCCFWFFHLLEFTNLILCIFVTNDNLSLALDFSNNYFHGLYKSIYTRTARDWDSTREKTVIKNDMVIRKIWREAFRLETIGTIQRYWQKRLTYFLIRIKHIRTIFLCHQTLYLPKYMINVK